MSNRIILHVKEPANKSNAFSVGCRTAICEKGSAAKCLDLFELTDKADGRYKAHPMGLTEQTNRFVNNFRQATSMTVIIASRFICSVSLRRIGLVRRFLKTMWQG